MNAKIAVYPGTFDPVTNGHLDIIRRARHIFDEVRVVILTNPNKKPLFSVEERANLIEASLLDMSGVRVDSYSGLLVQYMKEQGVRSIIRGLRAVSDLEFEFQNAHTNRLLYPQAETIFLMPRAEFMFLSSSAVREAFSFGGDLPGCVSPLVAAALRKKFQK